MGVPAGRQLNGAAGREAGTDERVKSGLTTFLTTKLLALHLFPCAGPNHVCDLLEMVQPSGHVGT
jgi:hypothetical protein